MSKECPTCGVEMESNGVSGDYRINGRVQGVDIGWYVCPNCETRIDDMGNVSTIRDQQHEMAWVQYAHSIDDYSIIP